MADSKLIYVKGMKLFKPNDKAPKFVLQTLLIDPNAFTAWMRDNTDLLTPYKDTKQLRCQILDGDKGWYISVDTYVPKEKSNELPNTDLLPF